MNRLDDFDTWIFLDGMLFESARRWWADRQRRTMPHEGLDLYLYRAKAGKIASVQAGMSVPLTCSGSLVRITEDFLGETLFVRHDNFRADGCHLFTIYGHTKRGTGTKEGTKLNEGEVIAVIADAKGRRTKVESHLHISLAWIPDTLAPDTLGWDNLRSAGVTLLDPLSALGLPHEEVHQ